MNIGDSIREKRISKNMTQQELADKMGLSRTYICDLENGRYVPSFKTTVKFAKLLGINLNFLANNDGYTIQNKKRSNSDD